MEPAQVGEEGADSDGEECEDPEQGAEGPEDAQPQPPAAELRLVCRVCSSAGASGQGFRGVRGYLQHLTRSHLDAAPEELLYVGEPWLLNTTTVVRVPRALITCGLVASDHEERADIPLRPGAVLPLTNPRGLRPAGAGPGAHDLDFLLCLDVSKLRSMRALPLLAEPGFGTAEGMGSAIALCATLATHPDPRRQQCGAIALALSGVMLLAVEKRGQRLSNAQRRARLDLFCAGDFRTLLTAFCANHEKQRKADLAALRGRPRVTLRQLVGAEQDLAALTRRAVKQGDAGSLRKLMDTLRNSVVGGKGAEVLPHMEAAQVQPAFPATEEQEAAIKNFAPAALHVVDPAILRTALEGMRPDAAGGPNGIRIAHILPSMDCPGVMDALVGLVQSLLSGTLDQAAADHFTASNLVALYKRSEPDAKPRPIACGDWLTRLAGRYITCVLKKMVLGRLEPLQLGSSRNGSEAAFHAVSTFLKLDDTKMALLIDQAQAFQHVSRTAMFTQLMADPELEWIVPFLRLLYASGSDLMLDLGPNALFAILRSLEGLRQGGAESSLLYNLLTLIVLKVLAAAPADPAVPDGPKLVNLAVGIVDDVTVVCDPNNGVRVLAVLKEEYAKLGCVTNLTKTKALFPAGYLPASFFLPVNQGGSGLDAKNCLDLRTPAAERGVRLLGAPLGSAEFVEAWLVGDKCFGDVQCDLKLILKHLSEHTQLALAVIKSCIITRVTHLARLLPPAVIVPHLERFDLAVSHTVFELVGMSFDSALETTFGVDGLASGVLLASDNPAEEQLHLRLEHGGLGLQSTARVAAGAYVASVLDCAPLLRRMGQLGAAGTTVLGMAVDALLDGIPADPNQEWLAPDGDDDPLFDLGAAWQPFLSALGSMAPTPEASAKAREIAFKVVKLLRGEAPAADDAAAAAGDAGAAAGGPAAGGDAAGGPAAGGAAGAGGSAGAAGGAGAGGAGDVPAADGGAAARPTQRQGDKLQHRLVQPAHAAAAALYAERIRGDHRRYAQHLSQCAAMPGAPKGAGYLATGWLTLMPWQRKLESAVMRSAIRIMMGLPHPALEHVAVRCKCGRVDLSATSSVEALEHISACNRFNKLKPHNTFAKSIETIIATTGSGVLIEREKMYYPPAPAGARETFRMDLVATGVPGIAQRLAVDPTITNPTVPTVLANAVLRHGYAANQAQEAKIVKYQQHIPTGDLFYPGAAELYGTACDTLVDLVEKLGHSAAAASRSAGEREHAGAVVAAYRQELSVGLMYARTGMLRDAVERSLDPHAAERQQRARDSYVYRVVHRGASFYHRSGPGSGRGALGSERVPG